MMDGWMDVAELRTLGLCRGRGWMDGWMDRIADELGCKSGSKDQMWERGREEQRVSLDT